MIPLLQIMVAAGIPSGAPSPILLGTYFVGGLMSGSVKG